MESFSFVNTNTIVNAVYENEPFDHVVLQNFFQEDKLDSILHHIKQLKDEDAQSKFIRKTPYEYNKYGFNNNYGDYLKQIFIELNSPSFIKYIEKITGISDIIPNNIDLLGAGVHRIKKGGYLQLHTDFNMYKHKNVLLDRRINLLIYMNPDWKKNYHGELCLCSKKENKCKKKILPSLNTCVIFNTTNESIHGHPVPLNVPENINRHSIAIYYYTLNKNNPKDFEGDKKHSTLWYPNIQT